MMKVVTLFFILLLAAMPLAAKTRTVAIVIYDGVEVLDFAGPAEVFESAGHFGAARGDHQNPAYRVFTVAVSKSPIVSQRFIDIVPDYSIDDAPKADIIVLPGGGTNAVIADERFMKWVTAAAKEAEVTLTVCTGAFVLAKAGLLDGLEATTWFGAIDRLRSEAPGVRVQNGRRFVDNGRYVTTAGVSAGIDGALHLVARLTGRNVADRTARYMEYHWTPESYLARDYAYLNPSLTDEERTIQQAEIFFDEKNYSAAEAIYRQVVAKAPKDGATWLQLGRLYTLTKRYDQAIEANRKAAQVTEMKFEAMYNIACAYALKNDRDKAIEALAETIRLAPTRPRRAMIIGDPNFASIKDDARFLELIEGL